MLQRTLTAQRVDFRLLAEEHGGVVAQHKVEIEKQHANHLDYLRVIEGNHMEQRRVLEGNNAMLFSAVGGLQAQLLQFVSLRPQEEATSQALTPALAQQRGTAANEPPQQPIIAVPVQAAVHRPPGQVQRPGVFQFLPHPIPSPPPQPSFGPAQSVRNRNRAARLSGMLHDPVRRRIRRGLDPFTATGSK